MKRFAIFVVIMMMTTGTATAQTYSTDPALIKILDKLVEGQKDTKRTADLALEIALRNGGASNAPPVINIQITNTNTASATGGRSGSRSTSVAGRPYGSYYPATYYPPGSVYSPYVPLSPAYSLGVVYRDGYPWDLVLLSDGTYGYRKRY